MQITASWGGADVEVEVDEECRSLAALKRALRSALPEEVDLEKVCLEVGGRALSEQDVVGLVEGSVVAVSPTLAARAVTTLREEGRDVHAKGFCQALKQAMCVFASCILMRVLFVLVVRTPHFTLLAAREPSRCAPFFLTVGVT